MIHLCEICHRNRPLTYHRGRDEYICDGCWDELPLQSTDDKSEEPEDAA
jgi:hypothetical protein